MTSHAPYPAPCAVCGRAGCGIAILSPDAARRDFCSMKCSEIFMIARASEIELKTNEVEAAIAGGKKGIAYGKSIGKSDMAEMTEDEWAAFLGEIVKGYVADLKRQAEAYVPF